MADATPDLGRWHIPVVLATFYRGVPSAMIVMVINFAAPRLHYWCRDAILEDEGTGDPTNTSACWLHINGSRVRCEAWEFDHDTFSSTIVEDWSLVCDRAWMRSVSQSVCLMGMFFGNFLFSHVSDRYGRRITVLLTSLLMLIFGVITAFSWSLTMFNITRFVASLGVGGIQSTTATLFVETVPSRYRLLFGATYGAGWICGQLGLVAVAWFVRRWFMLQLTVSLLSLPLVLNWWFLPESPRWLLSQGRTAEASKELRRAAALNGSLGNGELAAPPATRAATGAAGSTDNGFNFVNLLKRPKLRRFTIVFFIASFAHRLRYFHLTYSSALLSGDLFVNYAIVHVMELPGKLLLGALAVKFLWRRPTLAGCFIVAAAALLVALALTHESTWARVALNAVSMLSMSGAADLLSVFAAEVFPTCLRTVGLGSSYMAACVGATVAPLMVMEGAPAGVNEGILCFLQLLAVLSLLLVPETLHRSLPDTIEEAESGFREKDSPKNEKVLEVLASQEETVKPPPPEDTSPCIFTAPSAALSEQTRL